MKFSGQDTSYVLDSIFWQWSKQIECQCVFITEITLIMLMAPILKVEPLPVCTWKCYNFKNEVLQNYQGFYLIRIKVVDSLDLHSVQCRI